MSAKPVISVVVPAYNAAPYIGDTLESLLAQTFRDIEIIVVDDGSTDKTASIAEAFAMRDERVRVQRQARPSGKPSIVRNIAIALARGEYIALLDADDLATPTRFEEQLHALKVTGASVVFADFIRFSAEVGMYPQSRLQLADFVSTASAHLIEVEPNVYECKRDFIAYMLSVNVAMSVPTVMFARDLVVAPEPWFVESYTGGEDLDLFYRLAGRAKVAYVDKIFSHSRVHAGSLTAMHSEQCEVDALVARRLNLTRAERLLSAQQINSAKQTLAQHYHDAGYTRWVEGRGGEARSFFMDSLKIKPTSSAIKAYFKSFVPRRLFARS